MKELIFKNHFNVNFARLMAKWHLNFYLLGKGTPVSTGVYITDACNCRCIMCDLWKTKKPSIYPRDAQFKAIDALGKIGCYYYSVSGGETTLVKDLPDRLSYAARRIPYVHVVTNGLSMTPELARALGESGIAELSISIDGTEKAHNLLRGRGDAFEKAWRALDLICTYAPEIHIVINSMLTPYNLDGLEELGRQLKSFPKTHQKYLPLTFHELFRTKQRQSIPFPEEEASPSRMKSFIKKAIDNPRIVNSPVFLLKAIEYFTGKQDLISARRPCLYSYHAIEFDSRGNVYPCITGMNFNGGLPPDSDLDKYLHSDRYRDQQKELKRCDKCKGSFMLCYYEPRLNFPLHNLLWAMTWSKLKRHRI